MLKNASVKTSLIMLLSFFTFMQFFSNGVELFELNKTQKSTLLLQNIIKEQDSLHGVTDAVYKLRVMLDNIQLNDTMATQQTLQRAEDVITVTKKEFNAFWEIPGLTSNNPQAGKIIRTAFEQQMDKEEKQIAKINSMLSGSRVVDSSAKLDNGLIASRENFDNELENYYKATY